MKILIIARPQLAALLEGILSRKRSAYIIAITHTLLEADRLMKCWTADVIIMECSDNQHCISKIDLIENMNLLHSIPIIILNFDLSLSLLKFIQPNQNIEVISIANIDLHPSNIFDEKLTNLLTRMKRIPRRRNKTFSLSL